MGTQRHVFDLFWSMAAMQQPDPSAPHLDGASGIPSANSYEPHCLMAWEQMVAGMDEMALHQLVAAQ